MNISAKFGPNQFSGKFTDADDGCKMMTKAHMATRWAKNEFTVSISNWKFSREKHKVNIDKYSSTVHKQLLNSNLNYALSILFTEPEINNNLPQNTFCEHLNDTLELYCISGFFRGYLIFALLSIVIDQRKKEPA